MYIQLFFFLLFCFSTHILKRKQANTASLENNEIKAIYNF